MKVLELSQFHSTSSKWCKELTINETQSLFHSLLIIGVYGETDRQTDEQHWSGTMMDTCAHEYPCEMEAFGRGTDFIVNGNTTFT